MVENVSFTKKQLWIFVVAIIVIVVLSVYFFYLGPKLEKSSEIKLHKKLLYESILCQYSCQFENVTVSNQTDILPSAACIGECVNGLKQSGIDPSKFSNEELLDDGLFPDVENIISNCRESGRNNETGQSNYTIFFGCASDSLEGLKEKYNYLD